MRFSVAALALVVCPTLATAGPKGGGNTGGGGRLGQVSGGLRGPSTPPRPPTPPRVGNNGTNTILYDTPLVATAASTIVVVDGVVVRRARPVPREPSTARFEAYAGAQRVHESEGAWHVELGIRDRQFRLRGQITRYYEEQASGDNLTLTMPALIGGFRVSELGPTRVFLEAGFINAHTKNDPVADSSHTGGLAGFRLEHRVSRELSLLGDAHAMYLEDDVRATSARIGVRVGVLQASFRVLDFNVGPALYGPELGLQF